MATTQANAQLGQQVQADAKEYVLYSWSVQDAINPMAVAGAEGRHFWDYDGNRYLDFASACTCCPSCVFASVVAIWGSYRASLGVTLSRRTP